jgi:hypothetical protein
METEPNLVFVDCDTDTVETIRGASFIIDTDISALSDDERGILTDAYDYGVFGPNACRIIERVGVPVADLWAAYQWRQKILTAMGMFDEWCPVGELSGERHKYTPGDGVVIPWDVAGDPRSGVEVCPACAAVPEPCASCGATNDGVMGGLCEECFANMPMDRFVLAEKIR